jgi:PKD repeat protein
MKKLLFLLALLIVLVSPVTVPQRDPLYLNLDSVNSQQMLELGELKTDTPATSFPLDIRFGSKPGFDENNDGIEEMTGVVDIEPFSSTQPQGASCVRWEIYSVDTIASSTVCHGPQECCNALKLVPSRYEWDEPLLLTYGSYGTTQTNLISAQGIELKDGIVGYSKWKSLEVSFKDSVAMSALRQQANILKIEHPDIQDIRFMDKQGVEVSTLSEGEVDIEIALNSPIDSGIGIQSTTAQKIILENVESTLIDSLHLLDIAVENTPLEESIHKAGISIITLVSVENADTLSPSGGRAVFPTTTFTKVLHCSSEDASSCIALQTCNANHHNCYEATVNEVVVVHVPHFSSIILGIDNGTVHLNITSPDNASSLQSGENVHLNISTNISTKLNYSLDNGSIVPLGNGTSFSTVLQGLLQQGSLENGLHTLRINVETPIGTNATVEYAFSINDTVAPSVSLNISNNSAHSATYSSLHLKVQSSEHGNVSSLLNGQPAHAVLDSNRTTTLTLNPQHGANVLIINASDVQGNVQHMVYGFSFTELGSCSDGVQNGAELGVDCGGSCVQCIPLNVSVDRTAYNLSDTAYITVIARAYSTVNVTVKKDSQVSWRYEFKPAFTGIPIAETRAIGNTSAAGNYTVNATMYYLNITEQDNASFAVVAPFQSPMVVTIVANATTINENDDVIFSSSVQNNISSVSYKWDFQNDGIIESTLPNITWKFADNGTFIVNLTVADVAGNQTDLETIVVRKLYNLTVRVRDNSSGANIQGALVEVGNHELNSSGDGTAFFTLAKGEHDIDVSHDAYKDFNGEVELEFNQDYVVNLTIMDTLPPTVALISPENNTIAYNNSIEFVFSAYDNSFTSCVLYTRSDAVLWRVSGSTAMQAPAGQYSFALSNLATGTHEWKVECRDLEGNSNTTAPFSFQINPELKPNELSVDLEQQDLDTAELEALITQAIENLKGLGSKESELAEAIQLRKTLEKALTNIKRANRDLHSLEWRRLNESELERETQAILDRVEDIKKNTPKGFTLLESREFVNYASKHDVEAVVQLLVDVANAKLSKREIAKLIEENDQLQSRITITTKASRIELQYVDSSTKKLVVMQRKVTTKTEDFAPYIFYELVPKEVAKTADEMEMFFDHEVIRKDPVISIDLGKIKEYAYVLKEDVPLQRTESIAAVLAYKHIEVKSVNVLTGFSVLGSISAGIRETVDIRLIVEVIVIAILVVVYLIYSFGSFEELKRRFEPRAIKELRDKIQHAASEVENRNYEAAAAWYRDVAASYRTLDPEKRKLLSTMVTTLLNQVNVLYINRLLGEADAIIGSKDKKQMALIYGKIQALYKIIPKEYKAQVWQKCMELHRQLSS